MASLAEVAEAEFKVIAGFVEVTAATLSKHATALEQAGYVAIRKGYVGRRPRTWLSITPLGRARFAAHTDALRAIADPEQQPGR